jgi:hypothetical protein
MVRRKVFIGSARMRREAVWDLVLPLLRLARSFLFTLHLFLFGCI